MRGDFANNIAFVPWQHIPVTLLPPTASPVPTHQGPQRVDQFDPQPDYNSRWWEFRLENNAIGHIFQIIHASFILPSQRFDLPTDYFFFYWSLPVYAARAPIPTADNVPTSQPNQRTDPQSDFNSLWWESVLLLISPHIAPPPNPGIFHQGGPLNPGQRIDPFADLTFLWWEGIIGYLQGAWGRQDLGTHAPPATSQPSQRYDPPADFIQFGQIYHRLLIPPSASAVQTAQPSQRIDLPADLNFSWWEGFVAPHFLPTSISVTPSQQPSQRYDPQPDFTYTWWEYCQTEPLGDHRNILPPSASPVPTQQPSQRFDPQPDYTFTWWETPTRATDIFLISPTTSLIVVIGSILVGEIDERPQDDPFPWWFRGPQLLPSSAVVSASTVPSSQPSQRFDPQPDLSSIWWETVVAVHALPPSGSSTVKSPFQRYDAPQEYNSTWWELLAIPPHTSWSLPIIGSKPPPPPPSPVTPNIIPSQRFDAPSDFSFTWWEHTLVARQSEFPKELAIIFRFESLNVFVAGFDIVIITQ